GDAAGNKFLHADGTFKAPSGAGLGDVSGPGSSTDNALARFDGTSGKSIQDFVVLSADSTGALSRSGGGGIQIEGTNTNDDAASGYKGEYVTSDVASGSATSLSTGVAKTVASISLTAGDWEVDWMAVFVPAAGTTVNITQASISLTNNTADT